jgi:hypothetical protein
MRITSVGCKRKRGTRFHLEVRQINQVALKVSIIIAIGNVKVMTLPMNNMIGDDRPLSIRGWKKLTTRKLTKEVSRNTELVIQYDAFTADFELRLVTMVAPDSSICCYNSEVELEARELSGAVEPLKDYVDTFTHSGRVEL